VQKIPFLAGLRFGTINARQAMVSTGIRLFMAMCNLVLCLLLIGAIDLSLGEQTEGIAFFNDSGQLTLPSDSLEELQESMPELKEFPLPSQQEPLPQP
jgi:hypothetical protein